MHHPSLDRVQRWFQAVISHPLGLDAGLASDVAREAVDVPAEEIERVVTRSRRLSAEGRLQVYANAYYSRLLECLQSDFPALRHAAGDEAFTGFVFEYLQKHPSQSYTLSQLGGRFPQFLEETQPAEHEDEAPAWSTFLIDVARLERHYAEVFDGPGVEGQPALHTQDLERIPPERWGDVALEPAPCLRLAVFRFPVHEYVSAARRGEDPDFPAAQQTRLAIYRQDFIVRRLSLSETQFTLLEALCGGATLADALAAAVDSAAAGPEVLADLRGWFAEWTAAGFFRSVVQPAKN